MGVGPGYAPVAREFRPVAVPSLGAIMAFSHVVEAFAVSREVEQSIGGRFGVLDVEISNVVGEALPWGF